MENLFVLVLLVLFSTMLIVQTNGLNNTINIRLRKSKVNFQHSATLHSDIRIPFINQHNAVYYGEIGIGTPTVNFVVVFDTASADIWVRNKNWPKDVESDVRYDSDKSSTHVHNDDPEPAEITYIDGSAIEGFVSADDVTIGDVIIKKQDFVEATNEIKGGKFQFAVYDGILGLAFEKVSEGNLVPVWYNMINQHFVQHQIFSMWLKYQNDQLQSSAGENDQDEEAGAIVFGGYDESHFRGEHTYVPIIGEYYWEFKMEEILIGERRTGRCVDGCSAIMDSGHSFVIGPRSIIKEIHKALGADRVGNLDCNKIPSLPTISFTIGERVFPLSTKDYIEVNGRDEWRKCSTLFRAGIDEDNDYHSDNKWILGNVFMRPYHTIFDYGNRKLGIAESVQDH